MNCKASVVIPTYNREKYIANAIRSVLIQKRDDIEIIIVDDHSEDDTGKVVQDETLGNGSIIYCLNERAKGPAGARNTGILRASGDYVAFLDSDDTWETGFLDRGLNLLKRYDDIDVLFGNYHIYDRLHDRRISSFFDDKKYIFRLNRLQLDGGVNVIRDNLFLALIHENFFSFGSSLIKRSTIGDLLIDEDIDHAEDRDFAIRLYKERNATFAYINEPTFIAYRHDGNLTNYDSATNTRNLLESHIRIFEKYLRNYGLNPDEKGTIRKKLGSRYLGLSEINRKGKSISSSIRCIRKSFSYKPSVDQLVEVMKLLVEPFRSR